MSIFGKPFSSNYDRASVDPLTNFVRFPDFYFEEQDFRNLIKQKFDPERIPVFIHEATHHWCFDSPVFYALYLLQFRVLVGLIRLSKKQKIEEFDVIDDLYRYRAVVDLYRPIIEGLALFAEHIASPVGKFTYSHPINQAIVLTNTWFKEDKSRATKRPFSHMLLLARTSSQQIRKKASLLAEPIEPSRTPYLTGHMLISALWRVLLSYGNNRLIISDAFLSYMRSYFFFDYELIDILLDETLHEDNIVNAIAKHLTERIIRFSRPDYCYIANIGKGPQIAKAKFDPARIPLAIAEWDKNKMLALKPSRIVMRTQSSWFRAAGISNLDTIFEPVKGVLIERSVERRAQKRLEQAYQWLVPSDMDDETISTTKRFAFDNLMQRTYLTLCRREGRATVANGQCSIVLQGGVAKLNAPNDATAGVFDATLELVISSRVLNQMAFVYAGDKVIGWDVPKKFMSAVNAPPNAIQHDTRFQKFTDILRKATSDDRVVRDSVLQIMLEGYEHGILKTVDHVYGTAFMVMFPSCDWDAAGEERKTGLLGLAGATPSALRALANLSSTSCVPASESTWKGILAELDEDEENSSEEVLRYFGPESKVPLIHHIGSRWLVTV